MVPAISPSVAPGERAGGMTGEAAGDGPEPAEGSLTNCAA